MSYPEFGAWKMVGSMEVYRNNWMRVREDSVIRPDHRPGIYGVVELPPAVGIVAIDAAKRVTLVGQFRYPTRRYSWEIVTGFIAPNETTVTAARRELQEETGLSAGQWTSVGECEVSNGVTDQIGHLFLAEGLELGDASPESTEILRIRQVSLPEALKLAHSGEIAQALSIVGLFRASYQLGYVSMGSEGEPQ